MASNIAPIILRRLLDKEWSLGNGQCPECHGVPEDWLGHPLHLTADTIGHEKDCLMAATLVGLGKHPLMKGNFSGPEHETHVTPDGFLTTRVKRGGVGPSRESLAFRAKREALFDDACFAFITRDQR